MIRAFVVLALAAAMCTPASTKPDPSPPDIFVPDPPTPNSDAGNVAGSSGNNLCPSARQHMVEYGCPPAENFFGEWEVACAGKANGQAIAACIIAKGVCEDMRLCEESP